MRSDAELVEAALAGDADAFGDLVTRYKDCVYGLALSFLRDFDAACDISQEVFLRAFLNLHRLEDRAKLPGWLRSIAANACKTWLRQRRDSVSIEHLDREDATPVEAPSSGAPDEAWEREEARRAVLRAMSKLSENNRQALTLYYIDGLSGPEIASFLSLSPAAVRQRIRRARMQLQKEALDMVEETLQGEAPGDGFRGELDRLLKQARALFLQGGYQAAIPALEQASRIAPDDALVTMLIADAYTHGKTLKEDVGDRKPHDKAVEVLEMLVERRPDNLPARIKLAELRSTLGKFEDLVAEHEENLRLAEGGPYEPWALLRLARVYAPRRRHAEALKRYRRLIELEPRLAGFACIEMAISYYLNGDLQGGIASLKEAVRVLEKQDRNALPQYSKSVFGQAYWEFWAHGDGRLFTLHQAHAYLAGFYMKAGEPKPARTHLQRALEILTREKSALPRRRFVEEVPRNTEALFSELAGEPAIRQLRKDIVRF